MSKREIKIYNKDFLNDNQTVLAFASTPKHKHEFWEFVYWIKGSSENLFVGKTIKTAPGLVLFIRPNDIHENNVSSISYAHRDIYIAENELKSLCAIVKEGLFEELLNSKNPPEFNINITEIEFLESLINKASIVNCKMDISVRNATIVTLLGLYLNSNKSRQNRPAIVDSMIELIEKSVMQMKENENLEKIELQNLFSALHYSYPYISKLFKRYIGLSPKEFFIQKKMTLASVLLLEGHSVSKVSSILQYTVDSHFVKEFKKYYGVSPAMWRKTYIRQ